MGLLEMAAVSDCFSIGSTVACTTCFNKNIEGEVLAFDAQTKMLILKCPSSESVKPMNSDVYIVNLSLCSDVKVIKECSTIPEQPQSLNLQRLSTRVRNAVEQKKRLVSALKAGVSPEGQALYMVISKTINSEVTWSGPNIVIFNDVTIKPPYKVEHVGGSPDTRLLTYVKKIVEKFWKDRSTTSSTSSSTSGSSASSSSTNNSSSSTNNTAATTTNTTSTVAAAAAQTVSAN